MRDTTTDHAAAIRTYLEHMSSTDTFGWDEAGEHLDALAADNAALRAYARTLESCMLTMEQTIHPDLPLDPHSDYIRGLRDANNVAHLLD